MQKAFEQQQGKDTPWWPWYVPEVAVSMANWETSETPWIKIDDGTFAKDIAEQAKKVDKAFDDAGKLNIL